MKDTIFLIGFMGAGKSTIAKCLKRIYEREIVEMDQMIEEQEQMSIPKIFEEKGEEYFRGLETSLLMELKGKQNLVVSCGGGTPLRTCNVEIMHKSGRVIFLTASPETVYERVKNSHNRPLLEKNKNVSFIETLMKERKERYEAAADYLVSTDGRSAEEISWEIMEKMEMSRPQEQRFKQYGNQDMLLTEFE